MSDTDDRREYLFAAIADAEGTIRATDTKASISLVLHGLLFAGVLSLAKDVGGVYECAPSATRTTIIATLAAAALAFAISVTQLLRCIRPAPYRVIPQLPATQMTGTFFLLGNAGALRGRWRPDRLPATLQHELATISGRSMVYELAGELIKLSAIRARKTALITSGLFWLAVTFAAVMAFLVVTGVEAA
jgi:hypothetical protein